MVEDCSLVHAFDLPAHKAQLCEPCITGKMRHTSHSSQPTRHVRVLHRVHMYLCERYLSTMTDAATSFAPMPRKLTLP
jgi:hypothetical protein